MNWRTPAKTLAVVLPVLAAGSGCASFTKKHAGGLHEVDSLVGAVERVHFETELSKQRARAALRSLEELVSPEFAGDPLEAFATFAAAIDASEQQAEELRGCTPPMEKVAGVVFEEWETSLESFTIAQLRQRSKARLAKTRSRYDTVQKALAQAQQAYDLYNVGLRDHATFLGHDFNAASVAQIEGELQALTEWTVELEKRFDACLAASEEYVRSAALPGTVEVSTDEAAETRQQDA